MRGLTRYVFLELTLVFLLTLTGMTLLMVLVGIAHEAMLQGLGPRPIVRLVPYILPNALRFAVPGTMLFAACTVYGRMSGSNEIVAVKSLGASPMVVLWPALTMGFLVSLVAVWLNDVAVSWGRQGVERVLVQSVEEIVYGMLRAQGCYATSRFSIRVQHVDGRQLIRPMLSFNTSDDSPQVTIMAETAQLHASPDANTLSIFLTNGTIDVGEDVSVVFPDTIERVIPLTHAARRGGFSRRPSDNPLRSLSDTIVRQQRIISQLQRSLAADAAYHMLTGEIANLTCSQWSSRCKQLRFERHRLHRLWTEPYRRWANGFSCFFFVLIGAPLAIRMRNSDLMTTFGTCFLPILIVYYPLLAYAVDRAKCGAAPPYAVWLGNLILCLAGGWTLQRVIRY